MGERCTMTIGDYLAARPEAATLLERLKVDFCCGGQRDLDLVLRERGLDPKTFSVMMEAIAGLPENRTGSDHNPALLATPELIDHIVETHHLYLREQLPLLRERADKVLRAHGDRDQGLSGLHADVCRLAEELLVHIRQEEELVFPGLRSGVGPLSNLVDELSREHESAGQLLERIRQQAGDFVAPEWACTTYRALLEGLESLEADLHLHIHLENNILFLRTREQWA